MAGQKFIDWLVSAEGQGTIAAYKIGGEQPFFPNAEEVALPVLRSRYAVRSSRAMSATVANSTSGWCARSDLIVP